jgi:hypothetical protein
MIHPILFLMYIQVPEQLALAKETWASLVAQDVEGELLIYVLNNGSSAETVAWLNSLPETAPAHVKIHGVHYSANISPLLIVNKYLAEIFKEHDYVLSVPPDVILPPNLYREFLRWPRGIVTGSQVPNRDFPMFEESHVVSEHTPMAVALTRKWMHDALLRLDGQFNEKEYFLYASDCSMALRLSMCGIRGVQLDLQYFHQASSSWRLLPPEQGKIITDRADVDRAVFERRWGFKVSDPAYMEAAMDINFRG